MFTKFIRHVYKQPKSVRSHYAFLISLGFTGVIGLVWLSTTGVSQADRLFQERVTDSNQSASGLSGFWGEMSEQIASVTQSFDDLASTTAELRTMQLTPEAIESAQQPRFETEPEPVAASSTVPREEVQIIIRPTATSRTTTTTTTPSE